MRRPSVTCIAAAAAAAVALLAPAAGHAQQPAETISTVAGTGIATLAGDGGPAIAAGLAAPSDVAALPGGGFLIADTGDHRIRRVAPDGTIATVAGSGPGAPSAGAYAGDGGPATAARLRAPRGVAALPDGGFLIADTGNDAIRRVAPDGTIATVAGGPGSEPGRATALALNAPQGVAALPDGGFLVADTGNHRVVRVDAAGAAAVVAGTGTDAGPLGDGGPATEAALRLPARVAALPDGGVLIADTGHHRIRRVAPDGTITTVAGAGRGGFGGDGGPAVAALLNAPEGIALRDGGAIAIADTGNQRVREVAPDGTIRTIAGTGVAGFSGDGGDPALAQLAQPRAVAPGAGRLLVADTGNRRVRAIGPARAPEPAGPQADPEPEPLPPPPAGLPAPRVGRSAVVAPLAGTVRVRLPGRRRFVALDAARTVGVGAELDATRGEVAVFFSTTPRGRGASAVASQGRFRLLQPAVRFLGERPGLLVLSQPLRACGPAAPRARARAAGATAVAAARRPHGRRLKVRAKGRIRTKGRYGSAIVIGTEWTIVDRCRERGRDTTTVRVAEGVVQVRDFVRHRSVRVRAGRGYVARSRR